MILCYLLGKWPASLGLLTVAAMFVGFAPAQEPAQRADAQSSVGDAYRIRSGDKLAVKLLYHPEFNEPAAVVRPDGFITLPIIDDVMARGLTVSELRDGIEKAYSETLLNPVVTVNLVEFIPPHVYVGGQVAKPGSYELRAGRTLMQAIILAGGFTPDANAKAVLHARPAEDGKLKFTTFNVTRLLSDSATTGDLLLQDGDYVFVPNSKLSKISRILDAFRVAIPNIGARY